MMSINNARELFTNEVVIRKHARLTPIIATFPGSYTQKSNEQPGPKLCCVSFRSLSLRQSYDCKIEYSSQHHKRLLYPFTKLKKSTECRKV